MTNWQTICSGLATAAMGAGIIYFAVLVIPPESLDSSIRGVLVLTGMGMITGGAGIAAARANATSVAAHQESLQGLAELHEKHEANKDKIQEIVAKVDDAPSVVVVNPPPPPPPLTR
jgi:hypothetical protein